MVENGPATLGNGFISNASLTVLNGGNVDVAGAFTLDGPLTNSGMINVTNGTSIQAFNNGTAALRAGW